MSDDFFGGILDSVRSIGDDVSSFLGTTPQGLGSDVGKGIANAFPQNNINKLYEINRLNDQYKQPIGKEYAGDEKNDHRFPEAKSENFESVEGSWLQRLRKFSQIDSELQTGKVNEGKDQ